jgi:cytochrome P450
MREHGYSINGEQRFFTPNQLHRLIMELWIPFSTGNIQKVIRNTLTNLAVCPEWEQRIAQAEAAGSIDFSEDLQKFVLETIRFSPPQTTIVRPDGVVRITPLAENEALVGPNPLEFDPDRFENKEYFPKGITHWRHVPWLGFGGGNHQCVGSVVAKHLICSLIKIVLQRYEILADSQTGFRLIPREEALKS